MIKKYSNKTAYDADTRPNEDNVSLLSAEKVVIAERKNEETQFPERGDVVCHDDSGNVHYIKYNSNFDFVNLPSNYTTVGVVGYRRGNEVFVVHKTNASKKWAEVFLWKLSGYTLDGTDRTLTLTANSVSKEITYNATTDAEFAEQVNEALDGFTFGTHTYTCYVRDGVVVVQHNTYTAYVAMTATGVTIAAWVAPELTANSYMHRYNGQRSGEGGILNMDRSLIYSHADLSSTNYNPSSDITSLQRGYPICLPAYLGTSQYQSDHCVFLRNYYGDGEEGWLKFMDAQRLINPSLSGALSRSRRDGHINTYKLANQKYVAADGTEKILYPAFDYCASVGYDAEGLEEGNWFLSSLEDVANIIGGVIYPAKYVNGASQSVARQDADILNRALYAIGGTAIGNNSVQWSSCRYGSNSSWYYYGSGGFANASNFYNSLLAVPCTLLTLKS